MADELILDAPSWSSDDEILEVETPFRRRRYSSEGTVHQIGSNVIVREKAGLYLVRYSPPPCGGGK